MKAPEEKPPSRMGNIALVASAVVALALGGLCFWLRGRAEEAHRRLEESKGQYERMKQLKPKVVELIARGGKGDAREEGDPSKITAYLASKASQVGLPSPAIRNTTPPKSGVWSEFATAIELRSSGRDASIPRGPLVDFLAAVERERPYLKSKAMTLTFAGGNDLQSASVTISYFKRD